MGMAALPTALARGIAEAGGQWWRLDLSAGGQAAISQGDAAALQARDALARMKEGFKIYTHHRWFAVLLGGKRRRGVGSGRCSGAKQPYGGWRSYVWPA